MNGVKFTARTLVIAALIAALSGCASDLGRAYKAYSGEVRDTLQIAVIEGSGYLRRDLINNYVDSVRFLAVDDMPIENPQLHRVVHVAPGYHDVRVFFSWDLGSQRGLAPALVNYASTRETMSRTLRFNARAGGRYFVRAQPVFDAVERSITNLDYVDFWIEDAQGNEIVSREEGRYNPES